MTNSKLARFAKCLTATFAMIWAFASCVTVNEELGSSYLASDLQYDLYYASFDIDDIEMAMPDSLSSYSLYRFTIGAVRDEVFGLTTRSAAFTLVPVYDTLDYGTEGTQVFNYFRFLGVFDTTSYASADQAFIIQNVNVYELDTTLNFNKIYPNLSHSDTRITDGYPVYNGADTLAFNFSEEFGERFLTITQEELDSLELYLQRFPGIYMDVDPPSGYGGRINMFCLPIDVEYESYVSTICGSYASLHFSAEYDDRGVVDTAFYFYLSPLEKYEMYDVESTNVEDYPQICYNHTTHETEGFIGAVGDIMYMEGGKGLKPVIKAEALREMMVSEISQYGDIDDAIITKATITLPFEFPDDYTLMYQFPTYLTPNCRVVTDTSVVFGSLTDASEDDEDQGELNRSLCNYAPDITYHAQEILRLEDLDEIENYDIWLLPMADETVSNVSSTEGYDELAEYYQYLMYNSYYSSMYSGSSYYNSSSYSNYYNYYYYYQLYSSYSSTDEDLTLLDFHRYYKAVLYGPDSDNGPTFSISYALPKE